MEYVLKTGYLWRYCGVWEDENFAEAISSECDHIVFWQDSENSFGSYVLTQDDELPECVRGSIERFYPDKLSVSEDRPLLDCDESGVAAWIVDVSSDGEVTILHKY